jgi:formylglycine-generating enzyme
MRLGQLFGSLATVLLAVGCSSSASPTGTSKPTGTSNTECTGSYEIVQSSTGLCVAKMVTITGPVSDAGSTDYSIDVTEVTKGQYDAWVATNPALPASTDADCGWKRQSGISALSTGTYAEQVSGIPLYAGADAAHHPVADVDWCDAYAYCQGVGKRLCGAIGGGTNAYESYADATLSQWFRACSSGGADTYPYGNTYSGTTCDGWDYWNDDVSTMQTVSVGSLANCVTSTAGYAGVYDLNGNVAEWEDSCTGTGQSGYCRIRGGSFCSARNDLTCGVGGYVESRDTVYFNIGFRCCAP